MELQKLILSSLRLLFVLVSLSLIGCAGRPLEISSTHNVLTNVENIKKRTPVSTFKLEDNIFFFVYVMTDPTVKYGSHSVIWNWYKGGNLVSRGGKDVNFNTSPKELWTSRHATALGAGHYKVETLVDNQTVGTTEFDIKD